MTKEKILALLLAAHTGAEKKNTHAEKYILLSTRIEVILEYEGLIEAEK